MSVWLQWGLGLLAALVLANMNHTLQAESDVDYAIVIHGGAGGDPVEWTEAYRQQRLTGLTAALDKGIALLKSGADALDVVEQVVQVMEDDETFNAGRGCVLTADGTHELDASIMDGRDLRCGGVASVTRTKNPIRLARRVMTDTPHVLLIGDGADELGKSLGLEQAAPEYFRIQRQIEAWHLWQQQKVDTSMLHPKFMPRDKSHLYLGTVGCVVRDQQGNLAAATSTGGLQGKRHGRVGDSPIIGAGTYADNKTCAVSGTGVGEEFIRHMVAGDLAARMRYNHQSLAEAVKTVVHDILPEECGGVIAVDAKGNMVAEFSTPGMSRAMANSQGKREIKLGRED